MSSLKWRVWVGAMACICLAAASGHAQKITVRFENNADSVVVRVVGDSPIRHTVSLVGTGHSVNLDLQAHLVGSYRTIRVASGGISRMWVGWYQARPPITRLRIVTTERRPYRVVPTDDGRVLTVTVDKRLAAEPSERLAMPSEDVTATDGQGARFAPPVTAPVSTAPGIDAPDRPIAPAVSGGTRSNRAASTRRPATVRTGDAPPSQPKRDQEKAPVTNVEPAPVKPEGGASPATPAAPPVTTPPVVPQSKVNPAPAPVNAAAPPAEVNASAVMSGSGAGRETPDKTAPAPASDPVEPQQSQASIVPLSDAHSSSLPELIWAASGLFGLALLYTWIKRKRPARSVKTTPSEALTYKRPASAALPRSVASDRESATVARPQSVTAAPVIAPEDVRKLEQTVEQLMQRLDQKADEVIARIERERNGVQCDRASAPRPVATDEGDGRTEGRLEKPAAQKPVSRGMRELLAELDRLQEETAQDA